MTGDSKEMLDVQRTFLDHVLALIKAGLASFPFTGAGLSIDYS